MEKGKKNTNSGQFSRGGTGTKQSECYVNYFGLVLVFWT